ncbi:hypothetical protein GCM10007858_38250 [Bradyrhizobium liaoningense]|nr:hypothetical protein GCM10007858_38250 [Bradyrhizobium liaoningense]
MPKVIAAYAVDRLVTVRYDDTFDALLQRASKRSNMSDEIPLIPNVPQGLREAAQRGTLIPFVGAGASVLAGCPTWGQLAEGALKACIVENKFSHGQLDQIRNLARPIRESAAFGPD